MIIEIVGKNIKVTEGIRQAIESALGELDKYFVDKELHAQVLVRTYPIGQKVEMSVRIDKDHVIRQEVMQDDLYVAIDKAGSKLERQVRKLKEKIQDSRNKKEALKMIFVEEEFEKEEEAQIVKRKKLENKPMTEAEAVLQFELVGHDFYVFEDFEDEMIKVLYKRKDKYYGIIELD